MSSILYLKSGYFLNIFASSNRVC